MTRRALNKRIQHYHNTLSPDIKMHILLTVLHTFLIELVRSICLNITTSYPWWWSLYSHHLNVWTSSDNVVTVKKGLIHMYVPCLYLAYTWMATWPPSERLSSELTFSLLEWPKQKFHQKFQISFRKIAKK